MLADKKKNHTLTIHRMLVKVGIALILTSVVDRDVKSRSQSLALVVFATRSIPSFPMYVVRRVTVGGEKPPVPPNNPAVFTTT